MENENLNASAQGNVNTGVDVMTKFFDSIKIYADDIYVDGMDVLNTAIRAVSFYSDLYDAVDAFTCAVTDSGAYADTYERLRRTCGIILGDDEDYSVDTGAVSGYNAGGSEIKNAQDIVPEPEGATLSEQEMPEAGATVAKSFTAADGTYHTFTITAPKNFTTVTDYNTGAQIDISDNADMLALIEACAKGINSWWFTESVRLAYESYGLDFDNADVEYVFYTSAESFSAVTSNNTDSDPTRNFADTTPYNKIKIGVNIDVFTRMDLDNQNGDAITGVEKKDAQDYLDRIIAHEFIHATMFKAGLMKRNMPQFFTEGVADLIQGNDDYTGGYTGTLSAFATDYGRLSRALEFKSGTGTPDAYPAGYAFLRYLINQNLNTEIALGTDEADVYNYYGGDAVVSGYGTGDTINYSVENITGVQISGSDYFISSGSGTLLLRDFADKTLTLTNYAALDGTSFNVTNASGSMRIGSEYVTFTDASANFDLSTGAVTNFTGTMSGLIGGSYNINGETVSIGAADSVTGDGNGVTVASGEVVTDGDTISAGNNVTINNYSGGEISASVTGTGLNGGDVILYTTSGNLTIVEGAGVDINLNGNTTVIGALSVTVDSSAGSGLGVAGTTFGDTFLVDDQISPLVNGRAGADSIVSSGNTNAQIFGGTGDDTISVTGDAGDTIDAGYGDDFISLSNASSTTIIFSGGSDTVSGLDETAQIVVNEIPTVQTSSSNVVISGSTGTLTVTDASANDINFVYNILNTVDGAEITAGDMNDIIENHGDNVTINAGGGNNEVDNVGYGAHIFTGSGNDTIYLDAADAAIDMGDGDNYISATGDGASVVTGSGDDTIFVNSDNQFIDAGAGNDIFNLQETISGATIQAGNGNDTVYTYTSDTEILAQVSAARRLGDNALIYTNEGTITIVNGADKTFNVNGEALTLTNWNTGVDIMHKFFNVLKYYSDDTTTSGVEILGEAVKAVSVYYDLTDAIDNFVYDMTMTGGDAAERLLNAANIILQSEDTGAVSGYKAGGPEILNAEDIVPESVTSLAEVALPEEGSTSTYTVYGNDGTEITFYVKWQDSFTQARDFNNGLKLIDLTDQIFGEGNETLTAESVVEQNPTLFKGMTQWFPAAVKLAYDSYGLSLDGKTINAFADINAPYLAITGAIDDIYYDTAIDILEIGFNMNVMTNGRKLDADNPNGSFNYPAYIDRTLAHEMIHAVMFGSGTIKNTMPEFFTEGVAELVQGADDTRHVGINELANSYSRLYSAMNLIPGTGSAYSYPAGYSFLRYLINQNLDTDIIFGTSEEDVYNYYGGKAVINDFVTGDSVNYHISITSVDMSNGDYMINGADGNTLMLRKMTDKNISLNNSEGEAFTEIDGENFIVLKSSTGKVSVGDENYSLANFTGTFNLDNGNISNFNGTLGGFAGGSYTINGETFTLENTDIVTGDGSGATVIANGFSPTTVSGGEEIYNSDVGEILVGSNNGDTITNEGSGVFIDGRYGDDSISSSGIADAVHGGSGNDTIISSGDYSYVEGGAGDDYISVSGSNVTVETSAGNDTLTDAASDTLIIVNNPVSVTENLIVTENGTLNVEGSGYSVAYRIITNANDTLLSGSSGNDTIKATGENVSIDAGGGSDFMYYNKGITLANLYDSITSIEFNFTDEGLKLVNGGDEILLDYYTGSELNIDGHKVYAVNSGLSEAYDSSVEYYHVAEGSTLSGATGDVSLNSGSFSTDGTADIVVSAAGNIVSLTGSNSYVSAVGNTTLEGYESDTEITAQVLAVRKNGSDAKIYTENGTITIPNAAGSTINLNGEAVTVGNVNTGVDVMTKFFDSIRIYANDAGANGIEVLDTAIRAVSFYGSLEEAVDAFTYMITDDSVYADTYERLYYTCGIVLGADEDYTVDTGAASGYNAGGSEVKNAYDIVPEPEGAKLSEQEMPEAGSTKAVSFYGNDDTYHTFTMTAPENFHTIHDAANNDALIDVSDDANTLAMIEACAKGINAWWFEQAAKLAYDSFGLDFDGVNVTYGFSLNADYLGATTPVDSLPQNEITILIGLDYFKDMDFDNPNGIPSYGVAFIDRTIAHEFIHATMIKAGLFKFNMPQFFTEGVADLVHGSDDYAGARTDTIKNLAEDYRKISSALAFKAGTGTDNAAAYPGGYAFLRWLINQNLNTDIVFGTSSADVYNYYSGNAVVSGYESSDAINYTSTITGVELSNGDYLIASPTGYLLLRDADDKNISLGKASISGENFTITDKSGNMRVGSEYLTLGNVTATFDMATSEISSLTGAVSGFAGGSYVINGETLSLSAGDTVTGDGSGATVTSGDVEIFENTVYGGANATLTSFSDGELTSPVFGSSLSGSNAILYTSGGNITVLDGASLLGILAEVSQDSVGVAGTDYNDTLSATDKEFPLINGRGGDDLIIVTGGKNAQLLGGSGSDTVSVTGGESATIDAGAGNDFITLNDAESATVILSAGSDTLTGYNSTTRIFTTEIPSVTDSDGSVVIIGSTGTLTVTDASADEVIISHSIFNAVEGAEIVLGDGDDLVTNIGGSAEIYSGGGDDYIYTNGKSNSIDGGEGNDTLLAEGDSNTIYSGEGNNLVLAKGDSNVIYTGAGNDSIEASGSANTIYIGGGDDMIDEYTSDTNIVAQVSGSRKIGSDVVLTTDDGTITILKGADQTIIINGEEFEVGNLNTGVDVMKNFFNVLSWYSEDTTTNGVEILGEAVRAVSFYRDLADAIDNFIYDVTQTEGDAAARLENAANVILNGEDTGAVSGKNAGGSEIKNAVDVVPESVTSLADVALPEAGSTSSYTVTGNDGTEITFNVKWQDSFTAVRDFTNGFAMTELTDQTFTAYEDTITAAEILEYIPTVAKGMTQWFPAAVKLAYDSYGVSFEGKTIEAYFDVNALYVAVTNPQGEMYYDAPADTIEIGFNFSMFAGSPLDASDPNGYFDYPVPMYIDRVLAHEMIHGVMYASGMIKNTMPEFFTEGVADLVQGDDDIRYVDLNALARSYRELYTALSMTPGTGGRYTYAGGDLFLRYLINQNLNTEIIFGTDEQDVYEYYGGDAVINSFDGSDTVSLQTEIISSVELSNGDVLITSDSGKLMIRGGNAAVVDSAGEEVTPTAEEETVSGATEINNTESLENVVGSSGADTITNTGNTVFIDARGGDDFITSSGLANTIHGGAGDDTIYALFDGENSLAAYYSAYVAGGEGDDFISLTGANVTIETSAGNDTLHGADSSTVIIVNNPVSVTDNLITTENGTLNYDGGNIAYRIITNASDTLISGSSGNDTIMTYGKNVSIDAGGGNDVLSSSDYFNKNTQLMNLYDSISSIDFDFTDEGLKLTNGDNSILLSWYSGGELNIDGHKVYAVKEGNSIEIDSSVEYYNVADGATLTGLGAGETVVVNGATFAANSEGTEIISADKVVWSGSADELSSVNIKQIYDEGANTVDSDTLVQIANETLKRGEDGSPPQMAQLFFHPNDEDGNEYPSLPVSTETLTITSSDSLQLVGEHFAPETSSGNWVILITGYGHTKKSMYPFVDAYINLGYDVLAIDPRAAGDSEGEYMTMGTAEAHDVALWTQKIAELDSDAKIVLHGVSMGAATAMLAAADEDTTNVTGIIEDCGYTSVRNVFNNVIANASAAGITLLAEIFSDETVYDTFFEIAQNLTGYDVAAAAPINVISDVTVSSLFINGDDDSVAPASGAQELYEASGAENKKILIVEGAGHGRSINVAPETYVATVSEFILSSNSEGYIAQDDTLTIDGVVYTATGGYANLNLDSDGKVTGITTGKVTAKIADAETTPTITFDATDGAFEFMATANETLNVNYGGASIDYISGAVTYTPSSMEIPAGTVTVSGTIQSLVPYSLNVTAEDDTSVSFEDGMISLNEGQLSATAAVAGTEIASLEITSGIAFNPETREVSFASGTTLNASSPLLSNIEFSLTAQEDFSGKFGFDSSSFGISYTPITAGASTAIITREGVQLFKGDINLREGSFTYTLSNTLRLASGTVMDVTLGSITLTLTASGTSPSTIDLSEGDIVLTANSNSNLDIVISRGDMQLLGGNINLTAGSITFNRSTRKITAAEGTIASLTLPNGAQYNLEVVEGAANGTLSVGSDGSLTYTPDENNGKINISVIRDGVTTSLGDVSISSGSIVIDNSAQEFTLTAGTAVAISLNDYEINATATSDASVTMTFTDEGISFTPAVGDGSLDISLTTAAGTLSANIEVLSGSFIIGQGGAITVTEGTELKIDFGNDYIVNFKATDDAGGTISLGTGGITFAPKSDDGGLELSITRDGETRTASLDVTGSVTYKLDGSISLAEGTVVRNEFESGNILTITATSDATGSILFDPTNGLTITPAEADALSVLFTSGDIKVFDITSIDGSVNYKGGVITATDGTTARFTNYFLDSEMELRTTGGTSSLEINEKTTTYTANENATFVLDYLDGDTTEISNGSMIDDYILGIITAGSIFNTNDDETTFGLETAGTYTLNGNEITTTRDGLEVWFSNYNSIAFKADGDVIFNGETLSGDIVIANGEIVDSNIIVEGYSRTIDGVTYTAVDGTAELNLDSDGSVTGIASGKVTATATGAENPAVVTFDTSEGAIDFTATGNGEVITVKQRSSYELINGEFTYVGNQLISSAGATAAIVTRRGDYALRSESTYEFGSTHTFTDDAMIIESEHNSSVYSLTNGTDVRTINVDSYGTIINRYAELGFTLTEGSSQVLRIGDYALTATANENVGLNISLSENGVTLVPNQNDGSLNVVLSHSDREIAYGELQCTSGSITFGFDKAVTLAEDTSFDLTWNDLLITVSTTDAATTDIALTENGLSFTPHDNDGALNIVIKKDDQTVFGGALNVLNGTITFDASKQKFSFTEGTEILFGTGTAGFEITVTGGDASFKVESDENNNFKITPDENDGSLDVTFKRNGETTFQNNLSVSGPMIFNPVTRQLTLVDGTEASFTFNDYTLKATAVGDAASQISFASGEITITPNTGDGDLDITLTGANLSMSANIEVLSGSFIFGQGGGITVTSGTEMQFDFGDGYIVGFKATADAGGTIALGSSGITFAPNSEDGGLELSVTRNGTTRTTNLNVTGSVTYKLDGTLSLAEGTVISNTWEDGAALTITATTDEVSTVRFDPDTGLTVTDENALELSLTLPNGGVFDIDSITGTVVYKSGAVTLGEGTFIHMDNQSVAEQSISVDSGTAVIDFTEMGDDPEVSMLVYTISDNSSVVVKTLNADKGLIVTGGSFKSGANIQLLEPGSSIYGAAGDSGVGATTFSLDGDGEYTVNGITVTVSNIDLHDKEHYGTAIRLIDNKSIMFNPGTATISYGGTDYTGDRNILIDSTNDSVVETSADGKSYTVTSGNEIFTFTSEQALTIDMQDGEVSVTAGKGAFTIDYSSDSGVTHETVNYEISSGTFTYKSDASISLSEGTVVSTEQDGIITTITANKDAENLMTLTTAGIWTVNSADSDALAINITTTEGDEILAISAVEGTLRYDFNDGVITISDGTSCIVQEEEYNLKISTTGGESTIKLEEERIVYTPAEGAAFSLNYLGDAVLTVTQGSLIDTEEEETWVLSEGTVFTANDPEVNYRLETAGTYNLNGIEVVTTSDGVQVWLDEYNTIKVSVESGVTVDGYPLTGTGGYITYDKSEGTFSMTAGTVLTNVFDDGALTRVITANADAEDLIYVDAEGNFTLSTPDSETLTLETFDAEGSELMKVYAVTGTMTYGVDDIITLGSDTTLTVDSYGYIAKLVTTGGESTIKVEADRTIYTSGEGATFFIDYLDGDVLTLYSGSVIDTYGAYFNIVAGAVFTTNDTEARYILETAGTYNLNGVEITTNSDGVEVWLTAFNTFGCNAEDGITIGGYTFTGHGKVSFNSSDGSVSIEEGALLQTTGEDGTTLKITANKAADELIQLIDNDIIINSPDSDVLTIELVNSNNFGIMTISAIEGKVNFTNETAAFDDETSMLISVYGYSAKISNSGGTSSIEFNPDRVIYHIPEDATLTVDFIGEDLIYTGQNGYIISNYDTPTELTLSAGITLTTKDETITYTLETAGTYYLNGNEITTTSDGVKGVQLLNYDTIVFEAGTEIIFNGETVTSDYEFKIVAGELIFGEEATNSESGIAVTIQEGDTLTNAGDNVTIEASGGNQIENTGSNSVINISGDGNEVSNNGGDNVTINAGDGNNVISSSNAESPVIITGDGDNEISNNGSNNATINTGDGDNTISSYNSEAPVIITGNGDNSILNSAGNNATIQTGTGDDSIANENADNVYISAGAGDNSLSSACDNVTVISEGGNDTITAEGANNSITAGDGNNYIVSTGDNTTIISGSGDDTITNVNSNGVYIDAGDGDNQIFNGLLYTVDSAAQTLENYYESGTIISGSGNDTVDNYGGYYVQISTGDGSDSIRSYHSYYNTIEAGAGDDKIILQNGHYQNVDAGEGNDTIIGSVASGSGDWATGGHATLLGGDGDDYINPSYANDSYIEGGAGNDTIISRGPRQTIDAGEGNDIVSLGSANASESRTETTTENLIIMSGSDTIYGYESTSTIQSAEILSTELSGKDVILTTDEGTITVVKGAGQIINVNGEQIAAGKFEVADGETLEANGMTFTGSGKVTLAGDVPTIGAGVAVDGAGEVVLTKKGTSTINGQSFWLTEKVAAGVTVSTIEDGISAAHVITADDVSEAESDIYVGRIFKEEAYIYGDDEYLVRLDAGGLRSIFGLSNGTTVESKGHTETAIGSDEYEDDYSVLQLGLSEAGTYTFGGKEYTIGALTSDTPVGVNVRYETDDTTAITFVRYLNGNTISGNFTDKEVSVGSDKVAQVVSISGDDSVSITGGTKSASVISGVSDGATLYSGGGATKFTTDEEGSFYLHNYTGKTQNFTVQGDDSVDFVLEHYRRPDGEAAFQVDGVYNFENGTLIIDSATAYHAVNIGESVSEIVANKDKVMHFGDDRPEDFWNDYATLQVVDSKVVSIDGISVMENITGDVTVHGIGDITINGAEFYVDGDDDFNVIVEDGKAASIVGLDDGATLNLNTSAAVVFEDGKLSFGLTDLDAGAIEVNSSTPVIFNTDKHGELESIDDLNGTMYIYTAATFDAKEALAAEASAVTINGTRVGMDGSTKVSVTSDGENITEVSGFENGTTITGDVPVILENGSTVTVNKTTFALSGDKDSVSISGSEITDLGAGASLSVSRAGTYTVNGTAFDADADDTFVATAEGVYIYDSNNIPVTTDTATTEMLSKFGVIATPETLESDSTDLSTETVASAVSISGSGDQSVKFNNRGENAAIVSADATGTKDIELGSGGDAVIVKDTSAIVNVTTGAGNDTIVNQGANTYIDMAAGGKDKVYALGGTATLDNYHASTGSGLQTEFTNINSAIENGKINFRTGEVSLEGATVYVNDSFTDSTLVDFYDMNGNEQLVGFINTEGGAIDLSPMNKSAILVGSMQEESSIVGGAGDDTIYAAAGDTINGNGGTNLVKLSTTRKTNSDGAAIVIPTVRSATIVENFKTGFDAGDDYIRADISVSDVSYEDGDVVVQSGHSKLVLKDVGDGSSAKIRVDDDNSVIVAKGATAKVADEIADIYIGKESALDFSDDYERANYINLDIHIGKVGTHYVRFYGINELTAGGGNTTLVGSSANEEFYAGSGNDTIYGGGGKDTLHGYSGSDAKGGRTEFLFTEDHATIANFEFTTSENDRTADLINTVDKSVDEVGVNGDDVYLEIDGGGRLMIDGAAGKDFAYKSNYGEVVAQINSGDLTYDGLANYFYNTGKTGAKVVVSGDLDNAEVWLDGSRGDAFHGIVKELDGSAVEGNATLVGNEYDNVITAGSGSSTLWGGSGTSNDTLIGGDGSDVFWYEMGNGNDEIHGAGSNDTVNLNGVTMDMFSIEVGDDSVSLKFNDGGSLKLNTNDGTTFTVGESSYVYDKSDSSWKTK